MLLLYIYNNTKEDQALNQHTLTSTRQSTSTNLGKDGCPTIALSRHSLQQQKKKKNQQTNKTTNITQYIHIFK